MAALLYACTAPVNVPNNYVPCSEPATYDKFTEEELKWTNYKEEDTIKYLNNQKDTINFFISRVRRQTPVFTVKCKEHYYTTGLVDFDISMKKKGIINYLQIRMEKNSKDNFYFVSLRVYYDNISKSPIVDTDRSLGCLDLQPNNRGK